jgi:hypothetical protein
MKPTSLVIALAIAPWSAGCPDRPVALVDPTQSNEQQTEIPLSVSRDIDILFVVDNSGSMEEEQASLAANFHRFIEILEGIPGGLPDVHLGVVSSDLGIGMNQSGGCNGDGDGGDLQTKGCPGLGAEPYLSDLLDEDGATRIRNYSGDLAATFACMAELGIEGCGLEHHLEAMRRALEENPANAGFLRDDAWLAVIIIADEDDCSASDPDALFTTAASQNTIDSELGFFDSYRCWEFGVECAPDLPRPLPADGSAVARQDCVPRDDSPYFAPVASYVDFLKRLKRDPSRVIVAGIIGDPEPVRLAITDRDDTPAVALKPTLLASCTSASGDAAPATRLAAFLAGFAADRSIQQSICQDDLSGALDQIAILLGRSIGSLCLEGVLVDLDPAADGLQPDCRITEYQYKGTPEVTEASMMPCAIAGDERPCYRLTPDDACSAYPSGLALVIDRGGAMEPEEITLGLRCQVE